MPATSARSPGSERTFTPAGFLRYFRTPIVPIFQYNQYNVATGFTL